MMKSYWGNNSQHTMVDNVPIRCKAMMYPKLGGRVQQAQFLYLSHNLVREIDTRKIWLKKYKDLKDSTNNHSQQKEEKTMLP